MIRFVASRNHSLRAVFCCRRRCRKEGLLRAAGERRWLYSWLSCRFVARMLVVDERRRADLGDSITETREPRWLLEEAEGCVLVAVIEGRAKASTVVPEISEKAISPTPNAPFFLLVRDLERFPCLMASFGQLLGQLDR